MLPYRAVATEFEIATRHLRLTPDNYVTSIQLRRWCERYKNRYYIPEWLLKEWGILVEVHYGVDVA
jgi:hypothetical protein